MTSSPTICFGQQPCGIFPRRFLVAKILTARKLQSEIGGEIVFFCHDSDHDPRETKTILRHRKSNEPLALNFDFVNKTQRKFTPLYLKRVTEEWHAKTAAQLPAYVEPCWVQAFKATKAIDVASFCLTMYGHMGMLNGIRVVRSSDPSFRRTACEIDDFFVDVPYENEIVRARYLDGRLALHKGGDVYITLPKIEFSKEQISPTRDTRLRWMQSVIHCTHYVCGASEQDYLCQSDAPDITYIKRQTIDYSDEAYTELTF